MQMQGKTSTIFNKNAQREQFTQTQYQNKLKDTVFKKFRDQIIKNLTTFHNQQQNYEKKKGYGMEDEKKSDDFSDLRYQNNFMRYHGTYESPIMIHQSQEQKKYNENNFYEGINYEGHDESNEQSISCSEFFLNVNEYCSQSDPRSSMFIGQAENQIKLKPQQSTIQTQNFYAKIPDNHDFVIFGVKCPKIGISNHDLLIKKGFLQSRGINQWEIEMQDDQNPSIRGKKYIDQRKKVTQHPPKRAKNTKQKKQEPKLRISRKLAKQINNQSLIPIQQNSTKMRTRREDKDQKYEHVQLNMGKQWI